MRCEANIGEEGRLVPIQSTCNFRLGRSSPTTPPPMGNTLDAIFLACRNKQSGFSNEGPRVISPPVIIPPGHKPPGHKPPRKPLRSCIDTRYCTSQPRAQGPPREKSLSWGASHTEGPGDEVVYQQIYH